MTGTLVYGLCHAYDGISHDPTYRYGRSPCPKQRNPRSGSIGHARYRCWGPPGCRCRWRAAHLLQPLGRQRTKSLSVRRKSLTSVWRRSMSSTGRTSATTPQPERATSPPRLRWLQRLQRLPTAAEAATEGCGGCRRLWKAVFRFGGEVAAVVEAVGGWRY